MIPSRGPKPVLILGTDDVASAVGHALANAGITSLLVRDAGLPVLRRGMSFDDAVEFGSVRLDGVTAYAANLPPRDGSTTFIGVTDMMPDQLLDPRLIDGVIDARMRRRDQKADLRSDAGFSIGLGPGFIAGQNVDLAVETAPEATGTIVRDGPTIAAHGRPALLGRAGIERFARAPRAGMWWTFREIGELVEAGAVVGLCGGMQIAAPLTGHLRGLTRRGSDARVGMRLVEIDPRGRKAQCHGIPPRAAAIAAATLAALLELWRAPRVVSRTESVGWPT